MTTFYCPNCWEEIPEKTTRCPACGMDIPRFWSSMSYEEKLIHALGHPEPNTVMRAAWILGERKTIRAVPALIHLIDQTKDPYIAREAAQALAKIGTPPCRQALKRLTRHPVSMVRREAKTLLGRLP